MPPPPPGDDPTRTTSHTPRPDPGETGPADETRDQSEPGTTGSDAGSGSTFSPEIRSFLAGLGLNSRGPKRPVGGEPDPAAAAETIPGYTITGELGRGGMGVVYHARQAGLNRTAAIKMLLGDGPAGGPEMIRFLAEADAIAAVKHPNVVQVYEYGERGGRPFLALEFCAGGSLAQRLRATGRRKGAAGRGPFSPTDAAELVRKLAEGVAAAHDLGIVHRDLKPGNVLFDEAGEPKVSDFGLAKRGQGQVDLTRTDAVMGTPAYMSPEQARGASKFVGPAADVWALGVILYECLTGKRPFDADTALAVLRQVTDQEPESVRSVAREVPRDLELICRKCLAKESHERYPTARELADDLGRFLNREPVLGRPTGAVERLTKWVRRNPGYAALWGGLAVALLAGTVVSAAYAARAEAARVREAERAEAERQARIDAANAAAAAEEANRVAATRLSQAEKAYDILAGVFRALNPAAAAGDERPLSVVLKERVELAAGQLDAAAVADPLTLARMQTDLADALIGLGSAEKAVGLAEKALAVRREKLGPDAPDTLATQTTLALAHQTANRPDLAIPLHRDVFTRRTARDPTARLTVHSLANLGSAYGGTGRFDLAVPYLEDAWERALARLGAGDAVTLNVLNNLATAYQRGASPDRAVVLFEEALKGLREALPEDHPVTLKTMSNLAAAHLFAGRPDKARPLYAEALARQEKALGPDHPNTLHTRLGAVQARAAGPREKVAALEALVPQLEARLGKTDPTTLIGVSELATAHQRAGRPDLAVPLFERARAGWLARGGPEHPDTLVVTANLAGALYQSGRLAEAIPLFKLALDTRVKALGWDNPATHQVAGNLGFMYEQAGRWADAARVYADLLAAARRRGGGTATLLGSLVFLGNAQLRAGKYADAEASLREALTVSEGLVPEQWGTFRTKSLLGAALLGQGKAEEAGPLLIDGYKGVADRAGKIPEPLRKERLAEVLRPLVRYYEATGKADEARRWQAELDRLLPAVAPPPREVKRP